MSWLKTEPPIELCNSACSVIDTIVEPRAKDLGGFSVERLLPSTEHQMVGPFIFLDHMGPAKFAPATGIDVRPHPHIGLATITYLFAGTIEHRDSLGNVQQIRPGDVNWMTAGKGIVHSERSPQASREQWRTMEGLQIWVALPKEFETCEPSFAHYAAEQLPAIEQNGCQIKLIAGKLLNRISPVKTLSSLFYADIKITKHGNFNLTTEYEERAAYILTGTITFANETFAAGKMIIFKPNCEIPIASSSGAHFIIFGGAPIDGQRYIWWNFVASNKKYMDQAKEAWKNREFPEVPGDPEFIPLPENL